MSSVERHWTSSIGAVSPGRDAVTVVSNGSHQITDGTMRSHGISLIPELDLDYLAQRLDNVNENDYYLNYTYQNINGMIKMNSVDLMSGASNTPNALEPLIRRDHLSSPHWTPPLTTSQTPVNVSSLLHNVDFSANTYASSPTSTLSQYVCHAENSASSKLSIVTTYATADVQKKRMKRAVESAEIHHCQPVKRRVSCVGSMIASSLDLLVTVNNSASASNQASCHITYPRLSEQRYANIINEAQHQKLNLDTVKSVLDLLSLKEPDCKLRILAKCTENCSLAFNEFIDSHLDDILIISELVNLNAYSLLIIKNGNFSKAPHPNSPLAFFKNNDHLKEYFDNTFSSDINSSNPFALYKKTFTKVFSLLSFISSISGYLSTIPRDAAVGSDFIRAVYDNLNSDTISNVKEKINYYHYDPHVTSKLISIMWIFEDPNIKNAFAF